MKVLLCEKSVSGHRKKYLQWLIGIPGVEFFCYAPENPGLDAAHFIAYDVQQNPKKLINYLRWIRKISLIARENAIDVVHIPDGDTIMRFFGLGFAAIQCKRLVVTYHHFFGGLLRKCSYRAMLSSKAATAVAHTDSVRQALQKAVGKAVGLCRYPADKFSGSSSGDVLAAKALWNLSQDAPVIGIVGSLNGYKNILAFLDVLIDCKEPFYLLICGEPKEVGLQQIRRGIAGFEDRVRLCLRKLTDEEYTSAIIASDIIYCLYSHAFDGASGPMADGVCAGKMVLASGHGSLGDMVNTYHLGLTAEVSDSSAVLCRTEQALRSVNTFAQDETALSYCASLRPEYFREEYHRIYSGCQV